MKSKRRAVRSGEFITEANDWLIKIMNHRRFKRNEDWSRDLRKERAAGSYFSLNSPGASSSFLVTPLIGQAQENRGWVSQLDG